MNSASRFEFERMQIKRLIHENGGRDARALLFQNQAPEICGKYFDKSGKRCEISIMLTHDGIDLASAVHKAMLKPTVLG
jgi:hypothetical protein